MLNSIALLDTDVLYALSKMRTPVSAQAIPRDRANGCGDLVLIRDVQQFSAFVAGAYLCARKFWLARRQPTAAQAWKVPDATTPVRFRVPTRADVDDVFDMAYRLPH
jgi:hypothetical protein